MTTFTASSAQSGVAPKQAHVGVQSKTFASGALTMAASDVVLLCKIPAGATVLDAMVRMHHKADTQATANVFLAKINEGSGTAIASMGQQLLSATGGAVMFRPTTTWPGPTLVSLSDDASLQYALLKLSLTAGTTTASFSFAGYVTYINDQA